MTLSVLVQVPAASDFTAEVTTVERTTDGRLLPLQHHVLRPGKDCFFYPHDCASLFITVGRADAEFLGGWQLAAFFAFSLGEQVALVESGERGTVIGRAEYAESARRYLIRYRAGDGRLTEGWWNEPAIAALAPPPPPVPGTETQHPADPPALAPASAAAADPSASAS